MASKGKKTVYACSACGHEEQKWLGRCPACGEWNTLRESLAGAKSEGSVYQATRFSVPLGSIDPQEGARVSSGLAEVDRVLGGGLMRGATVLIGGEPGIGKSTLLLQVAALASVQGRILYVSGEESAPQLRLRSDRLGLTREGIEVFCSGKLEEILATLERVKPTLIIVDSIQTVIAEDAGLVPGTANQVKLCALELADWARGHGAPCFLVAHVTKDGLIAGPKAAEHIVDVVLLFEQSDSDVRFLRSTKNRYGSTDEVGLFLMEESGLTEISDAASVFLVRREGAPPPGTAVSASWEGTRCLTVEIQALTVPSKGGMARVYSERIEASRVARIAAVLEKQTGIKLSDQDIYVNVAGGIRLTEPGIDMALACAMYSARTGLSIRSDFVFAGEITLAGEIRYVRKMQQRAKAAASLGFSTLLGGHDGKSPGAVEWKVMKTLGMAIKDVFGN